MDVPSIWYSSVRKSADSEQNNLPENHKSSFEILIKLVSSQERQNVLFNIVWYWPVDYDRRALLFTSAIVNLMSGLSGLYISRIIRQQFFLGSVGLFRSTLSSYLLPAGLNVAAYFTFIWKPINDIILAGDTSVYSPCPICFEIRQLAVNLTCGVLIPILSAPLHCAYVVESTKAYEIPHIRQFRRWNAYLWSKIKPLKMPFLCVAAIQTVVSSACLYSQMTSLQRISDALKVDDEISSQFFKASFRGTTTTTNHIDQFKIWLGNMFNKIKWKNEKSTNFD
ncbi:hypothetical protein T4D_14071 [Trichinella pseudospiralis]|uniref:Transmembrane protein n=1 Tax=Trichinella pseudospiralis TaxID=6337 RepID=A0A0V1FME3_TRIPS|nr:hypothetical protein T4D_14071 [Trichinella pseudospiralis]